MPLLRDARTLSSKAICSLRIAMATFNSFEDEGRVTSVLLHLQHAAEMLLKASLVEGRHKVFEKETGKSFGFEKCLRLCQNGRGLIEGEAGVFRAIDALRDAAQHWFVFVSEDLLYMHIRAFITAFDSYMKRALGIDLNSHIPARVLPVSTKPPGEFNFLIDREYNLIRELLAPGKRQRDEARARIRSLLAMEAIVHEGVEISEKDINRIERAAKDGKILAEVFPRLNAVNSETVGEGPSITVHFSKKQGPPVQFVAGDDPAGAAAVREVDLNKKFYMRASDIARKLGLTEPRALALRRHLQLDSDPSCCHTFEFGKTKILCFSDNARNRLRVALDDGIDMEEVWKENRPGRA